MNNCQYCGKLTSWVVCTECHNKRDPDLQASRLVMACLQKPERAKSLLEAMTNINNNKRSKAGK